MKVCLYSPYVPKHMGGGEKYFFDVARILSEEHEVFIAISGLDATLDQQALRSRYEDFIAASLQKMLFIPSPLGTTASLLQKLLWTRRFDALYYVTDGSLFFSLAPKNIVHIQIPFTHYPSSSLARLKLQNWPIKNSNSAFTKSVIEHAWKTKVAYVHYPIVPTQPQLSSPELVAKEKIILHVGRFFTQLHAKRQDILVEIFREMVQKYPSELKDWKLVFIGSVEDQSFAERVAQASKGLPIEIHHQVSRSELSSWYRRARIYWHATGYDIDEEKEPEKVEHFGISTGEAMSFGCVPVVLGKGGQREVVGDNLAQFLWQTKQDCAQKTIELIRDEKQWEQSAMLAQQQVARFSEARFRETLQKMMEH